MKIERSKHMYSQINMLKLLNHVGIQSIRQLTNQFMHHLISYTEQLSNFSKAKQ